MTHDPINVTIATDTPVGMAYVPIQAFENLYSDDEAFKRGTVFQDLDLPFTAKEGN